ncbi:hypothetical protein ILUMI_25400 [Ignelater luminosus]|uniref:Beta-hexosaminidase n=1 Tax=Ignelater luminosus TaxID=2038154 RepID=A0A8K0C8L6_IGNLU|nr:hypothetical protein ILUMI_25400 [Ignelater luminosus]
MILHRIIMKPAGLRRVLYVLLLMCGVLVFYLFWHQITPPLPAGLPRAGFSERHARQSYIKLDPLWTWECTNQRCERRTRDNSKQTPVSLTTCNMLCGSTQLWPQPSGPVTLGTRAVSFYHNQIQLETSIRGSARKLVEDAFTIFYDNIANMVLKSDKSQQQNSEIGRFIVRVHVARVNDVKLRLSTDERYYLTLRINQNDLVANINATTFFGARHGLETLSQLVWWDEFASGGMLRVLKGATVQDAPAFPYRGIMLDTSRNFIPLENIKRALIGMSANKLNVFHWHISDSQSFPFMSPRVPQLAKYGAYSADMMYNANDIKEIVDFALVRGIRVIIEVDTPAHAGNGWTWGPQENLGELAVCVNEQPWSLYCGEPPCGQLNPQNPHIYDVLEKLYKDILELSNETEIFHLGGDEVNLECWSQHLKWEGSFANYTDLHDLWGDFTLKALKSLANANGGRRPSHVVVWSSNLSKRPYTAKYLDKNNIVVQTWGPSQWTETLELLMEGYRLIISHVDAWYLDCGFGRWRETGEAACDPYRPWQSVYNHRPWQQPHINKKLILGGEACLWSEQLDPDALDARLWPRAAAFAERIWSDPQAGPYIVSIAEDVYTRLGTQRDRLVRRGLGAEAMWPVWCTQNPGMCL